MRLSLNSMDETRVQGAILSEWAELRAEEPALSVAERDLRFFLVRGELRTRKNQLLLLRCNPGVHLLLQQVHRQRSGVQHSVVKSLQIELRSQLRLCLLP